VSAGLLLLSGCAHYAPQPLDPHATAAALAERHLPAAHSGAWQPTDLLHYALEHNPAAAESREQLRSAMAAVDTARELPNPTLGLAMDRYVATQLDSHSWLWGFTLDFPVSTMANRSLQTALAQTSVRQARLTYADTLWQLRSDLRSAVTSRMVADRQLALVEQWLQGSRALQAIRARRVGAGELATSDGLQARLDVLQAEQELATAQQQRLDASSKLAAALGVAVADTQNASFEWHEFTAEQVPFGAALATLRDASLVSRSDIERALSEYDARELELHLAVRAQYPQLNLGPGYTFDHGVKKVTLAANLSLPVFNRNSGPIAEAEARRAAAGLHLEAVQSQVLMEIDSAAATATQAASALAAATEQRGIAARELARTRHEQEAGDADRVDLLTSSIAESRAELAELAARSTYQQAIGALETALRTPLNFAVDARP
jgi:outer membrane protein TolC